ncbi:MAG: hypothetical protein R6X16_05245, partial [Anaerolineae bacterium]
RVCFTMDCEQVDANQGGPPSWEYGERSIRGYCEALLKQGLGATLFVVPGGAEKYRAALLDLVGTGIELGLHYHPQDHGYHDFLGAYTGVEQCRMLSEAKAQWTQALSREPIVVRPGNFSANDATFPVLSELGFLASSTSCPLRNFIDAKANWTGAPLDPHFAHAANRLLEGDLPLFEVPLTVDWESFMWGGRTPLELRIEMVDARAHGYTVRKAIRRQLDSGTPDPVLVILTHSVFDYSDPSEFRRQVLDGLIAEISKTAELHELTVESTSLVDLRAIYLEKGTGS